MIQHQFLGKPHNFADREFSKKFFAPAPLVQPIQVHGIKVPEITQENFLETFEADGCWTREKNIMLSIMTADCQGLLFHHPDENIIAAIHAGWKGLAQKISTKFLSQFPLEIRKDFRVYSAPSLGPCCSEFTDPYKETPEFFHNFIEEREGKYFVDLWRISQAELREMGILEENIFWEKVCTKCGEGFWSFRHGHEERNISCIVQT